MKVAHSTVESSGLEKLQSESIKSWIANRMLNHSIQNFGFGAAIASAGFLVVLVTFWSICIFLLLVVQLFVPMSTIFREIFSAFLLTALFLVNALLTREPREKVTLPASDANRLRELYVPIPITSRASTMGGMRGLLLHGLLDPRSYSQFFKSLLFLGPYMLTLSLELFRRARRLYQLNYGKCSTVVAFLFEMNKPVSFAEIMEEFPMLDAETLLLQLREIDGLQFITTEPISLALSSGLKQEFLDWQNREQAKEVELTAQSTLAAKE